MGTLVNGIKEIFATSQSTATHLPVCASDGTPQGRISVGDLASVLGGTFMTKTVSDLNDAQEGGVYKFVDNTLNRPISYGTCLVMVMQNNRYYQLAYGFDNVATCRTFFRMCAGSWTAWQEVSADIPSFYKNYNSLSALGTALNVGRLPTYTSRNDLSKFVRVVINAGYNSVLLSITGQYEVAKPQIVNLYYRTGSIRGAYGYLQGGAKIYFKEETAEHGSFFIGNATLYISVLCGTGTNYSAVTISEVDSLPSDTVEITVTGS